VVDQVAVVTVSIPATATPFTVDFTDPSITEPFSAAIFIFTRETADGSDQAGADIGIGFVSAERGTGVSGDQAMSAFAQDGAAAVPNAGFSQTISKSISITDTALAGTVTLEAAYSSSIPGGVRMNVTTRTITCKVTAILFAGLSRAAADACSATTSSATEGVGDTSVGTFSPDLVVFAASDTSAGTPPANGVGAHPNIGFAIKATLAQVCAHISVDDATEPTDADGFIRSAAAFGHLSGARALQSSAISAFPASGFTHQASAGTINAHYLALKFSGNVRLAALNFAVAASTGSQAFNGFGFTPDLVFGMGTLLSAVDAALEDGALASCMSYFVTGRYASRALTIHHKEGINIPADGNSSAHTRQEDVAVLQYDHLGNVVQRATWVGGSGSGGFILSFSTASAAGFLTALGIQFNYSAPRAARRLRRQRRLGRRLRARLRSIATHAAGLVVARRPATVRLRRVRLRRGPRRVFVTGRPPGQLPLRTNFWRAIQRIRRNMFERLRWRPRPVLGLPEVVTIGAEVEEGSGRITSPGATRGRVVGAGAIGRVVSPGATRGGIVGPGTELDDFNP